MAKIHLFIVSIFLFFATNAQTHYTQWVNPFIGTGGHGHTFPGPVVPFGMVQVGPDTRVDGSWDGCSGYHHSDSIIYGFSHTHLSGTGCSDYGDVMLMPMAGQASFEPKVYASKFKHEKEFAKPGYYKVNLADDNIDVELTSSTRVGLHKYTFNNSGTYQVILDLLHRDKLLDGQITIVNNHCIEGYRRSQAWAQDQRIYFRIEFSKPNKTHTLYSAQDKIETGAAFEFKAKKGETLLVKVAISTVDIEGARKNILQEMPKWDFAGTQQKADDLWNLELSKISVKGGSLAQKLIFYTALYHCFIHPSIANDVDGRYLGRDFKIYKADSFNYYSVFSLWDTFRALHPLFNLVQRERNLDFIKTFLAQYKQVGRMPMWELGSNETDCMIGYHSVSVIADALAKNIYGFDPKLALEACLGTAKNHPYGYKTFEEKGYLSVEDEHESVSKTLEYAYNQWCLNQIKQKLGSDQEEKQTNLHLSFSDKMNWQNVFNPKTGFMQPRQNGGWYSPFNPKEVNNNYTEANAWQYTFFVPQDIPGLIAAMGGPMEFEKKLDELFETGSETSGRVQADISGLIGQYAHGNEPSHHMAYLYNYVGKPHKTQARVSQILNQMYQNAPDGLAGNEDCGQMSAWYVFSAMGFYPVTPGIDEYEISSPLFDTVVIQAGAQVDSFVYNHKTPNAIYVNTALPPENSRFVNHKVLSMLTALSNPDPKVFGANSTYHFNCSNSPFLLTEKNDTMASAGASFLPSPIIETVGKTFKDSLLVTMFVNFINEESRNQQIHYRITDNQNTSNLMLYTKPFYIHRSCKIEAFSCLDIGENLRDLSTAGSFYKCPNNWNITLNTPVNKQYTAGGADALIDGVYGEKDWRKGGWQGYLGNNLEAVLDLKSVQEIHTFYGHFLQDQRPWIMMPKEVEFYVSTDGINFVSAGICKHQIPAEQEEAITQTLALNVEKPIKARYVKVVARNYGKLPKGHLSEGEPAYIFVDEIGVK